MSSASRAKADNPSAGQSAPLVRKKYPSSLGMGMRRFEEEEEEEEWEEWEEEKEADEKAEEAGEKAEEEDGGEGGGDGRIVAGTARPQFARSAIAVMLRNSVDLPLILGPVTTH